MKDALKIIYSEQKEIALLLSMAELLYWDQMTHMPKDGIIGRSELFKFIEKMRYEKITSERLTKAMKEVEYDKLGARDKVVIDRLKKEIQKKKKIPKDFNQRMKEIIVEAESKWKEARKRNNFDIFMPYLKKVIEIKREQAVYTNPKKDPYDVLIEEYEEGMDSKKLDEIFSYLKTEICELLKKIKNTEKYKNQKKIMYYVKRNEQKEIVKKLIKKMGIREDRLSIDTSMHPFSTMISQNDVRITTKYSNPIESFFASIHEAGHALYDLGLPKKYHDTVVYDAASFGMHESQSIFWENMICKNELFWKGYFKKYKQNIKIDATWKEFYEYVNHVKPTFIRMDADEVTYCLHIIIRYEIEKDLIQGKLKVKDVKKVWNEKSKELLGIVPKDDNDGVLQDIHWADGDFGYFPSYALGMIYSVQLFNDIKKRKIDDMIIMRDFKLILEYLRKNVHSKGKTMTAEEIIIKCCGKGLDPKQFVEYLNEKYSKIYGFNNNEVKI